MDKRSGIVKRQIFIAVILFFAPIVLGFAILSTAINRAQRTEPDIEPLDPRVRHIVSNRMESQTEKMAHIPAPGFDLQGTDGKHHTLTELTSQGPILLYFVNHECPCSEFAEPMYNAFATQYPSLKVVGIVDDNLKVTQNWAKKHSTNHLHLADPSLKTIHAYKAEASVFTALVTQSGKIVKMWPGYSQEYMNEESKMIADLVGAEVQKLDPKLAPKENAAGCAFAPAETKPQASTKSAK